MRWAPALGMPTATRTEADGQRCGLNAATDRPEAAEGAGWSGDWPRARGACPERATAAWASRAAGARSAVAADSRASITCLMA